VDFAGSPEAAVDWAGDRIVTYCGFDLVALEMDTLTEVWRVPISYRSMTKAPGGLPALAIGEGGTLAFVLHYRALQPGDANRPGASLTWLTAHDLESGAERGRVDFPDCLASRLVVGSDGTPYVTCRDRLHAIDIAAWSIKRTLAFDPFVLPIGMLGDRVVYGVSRELQAVTLDVVTGDLSRVGLGSQTSRAQAWGRLAMTPGARSLVVLAKRVPDVSEYEPDTLAAIDLHTGATAELPVARLRGVGAVGPRIIYAAEGHLRSIDGAIDVTLLQGRVHYWDFFAEPART
jgi:hypothetical protein